MDLEDEELGLANPYSQITCFILYLYSLEFGRPSLQHEINRVTRNMDLTQLQNLGPFAKAMSLITLLAERNRKEYDKIMTGDHINENISRKMAYNSGLELEDVIEGSNYNLAGIFLLWRGV